MLPRSFKIKVSHTHHAKPSHVYKLTNKELPFSNSKPLLLKSSAFSKSIPPSTSVVPFNTLNLKIPNYNFNFPKKKFSTQYTYNFNNPVFKHIMSGSSLPLINQAAVNHFKTHKEFHPTLLREGKQAKDLMVASNMLYHCRDRYTQQHFGEIESSIDMTEVLFSVSAIKTKIEISDDAKLSYHLQIAKKVNQEVNNLKLQAVTDPVFASTASYSEYRIANEIIKKGRHESVIEEENFLEAQKSDDTGVDRACFQYNTGKSRKLSSVDDGFRYIKLMTDFVKKNKVGNCHEMALIAMENFIRETNGQIAIDLVSIKNGDHVFLIIDPGSDAAAVLDVWDDAYYPASDISRKLPDCTYRFSFFANRDVVLRTNYVAGVQGLKVEFSYRPDMRDIEMQKNTEMNYRSSFRK